MSATLMPPLPPRTAAPGTATPAVPRRRRAGHEETARSTARLRRSRTITQVVPTDCATCLSAGSVRRGICEICGRAE